MANSMYHELLSLSGEILLDQFSRDRFALDYPTCLVFDSIRSIVDTSPLGDVGSESPLDQASRLLSGCPDDLRFVDHSGLPPESFPVMPSFSLVRWLKSDHTITISGIDSVIERFPNNPLRFLSTDVFDDESLRVL